MRGEMGECGFRQEAGYRESEGKREGVERGRRVAGAAGE